MVSTLETFNCTTHTPLPVLDRSGRSNCFNCIIETFQTQAYNLARRMLDDWVLAEDAVQESLISAYRAFHNYWGDNLKAWLMRIVANTCRDMMRARRSRPTSPLDPLPADSEGPNRMPSAVDLPSGEESPEAAAERGELNRAIQNGLNSLQEEQRLAVALVDIQGLSYEEVALAIGCSLGTVKSRVSRGWRGLRDFLQRIGELLPSRFRHSE